MASTHVPKPPKVRIYRDRRFTDPVELAGVSRLNACRFLRCRAYRLVVIYMLRYLTYPRMSSMAPTHGKFTDDAAWKAAAASRSRGRPKAGREIQYKPIRVMS
jgi:hypothetical protein